MRRLDWEDLRIAGETNSLAHERAHSIALTAMVKEGRGGQISPVKEAKKEAGDPEMNA